MCTRYALEKELPELKDIFEIALRSSLTSYLSSLIACLG